MKHLWLVGESLPLKEDGSERKAHNTTNLPSTLVPLDPRHGVFPNLVMKPLFAAGYSMSQSHVDQLLLFFQEMKEIVSDESKRRFNVFENRATKSKGRGKKKTDEKTATEIFEINDATMTARMGSFDLQNDLWLVFGHQTNFGLLWWLLDKETAHKVERPRIKDFSEHFVSAVGETCHSYPSVKNSQLSSRIGLLHRLCTGSDTRDVLEGAITKLGPKSSYSAKQISEFMRATVPLLHNEGYQDGRNSTGNAQSHFVRQAKGKVARGDLYWQVMGNAVATRVLGNFVE